MSSQDQELQGFSELNKKLDEIGAMAASRVVRSAAGFAMTPVLKDARASAPKGDDASGKGREHKTYRGRRVYPGFASRNIRKTTKRSKDRKRHYSFIGVAPEAFYLLQFIDKGWTPKDKKGVSHTPIKATEWAQNLLDKHEGLIISRFKRKMAERIEKIRQK